MINICNIVLLNTILIIIFLYVEHGILFGYCYCFAIIIWVLLI